MPYYILLVSSSEQQTCFIHTKNTETLPMCLRYTVRKNIWVINGISNSYVQQTVGFLVAQWEKNLPAMQETQEIQVQFLDREDPLEEGMATHSSIPAWRIPWTEEPGRLQSMWSQRVRHNWSNWAQTHDYQCSISTFSTSFNNIVAKMNNTWKNVTDKNKLTAKVENREQEGQRPPSRIRWLLGTTDKE